MATRVLGIAGSPRRRGNTEQLLDRFLAGAASGGAEVDKIVVARLTLGGCRACDGCWDDGQCVIQDDFQEVNRRIVAADVLVLAAPLYFWGLPAQVKALVDRGQCQWARKFILHRPLAATVSGRQRRQGVFISVGGEPRPWFDGALKTVRGFFGVYETDYRLGLLYGGLDARGAVADHPTALSEAFAAGVQASGW